MSYRSRSRSTADGIPFVCGAVAQTFSGRTSRCGFSVLRVDAYYTIFDRVMACTRARTMCHTPRQSYFGRLLNCRNIWYGASARAHASAHCMLGKGFSVEINGGIDTHTHTTIESYRLENIWSMHFVCRHERTAIQSTRVSKRSILFMTNCQTTTTCIDLERWNKKPKNISCYFTFAPDTRRLTRAPRTLSAAHKTAVLCMHAIVMVRCYTMCSPYILDSRPAHICSVCTMCGTVSTRAAGSVVYAHS